MKNYDYILAFDPSGNYNEGKGTTGYCIFDTHKNVIVTVGYLSASQFDSMEAYWKAHINLLLDTIKEYKSVLVVIEDYLLYAHKKDNQINSRFETSKLIGTLQYTCFVNDIDYIMQTAAEVKNRWADDILVHKGYVLKSGNGLKLITGQHINRHIKDAIRHAVHAATFKIIKEN